MTQQAVHQGFSIEVPQKNKEGQFFVFFAADQISGEIKSSNPLWAAGGLLRPKAHGLSYRNGYIRKCEITQLLPQMVSTSISNVHPSERRHLIPTYKINDGGQSRIVGVTKEGMHDGLLRTEWHPQDEIERLTSQVDGLIRMPVANAGEALHAQYFLFPDWDNIVGGSAALSRRISDLEAHFRERLAAATNDVERAVANAAIKSCTEYAAWGERETRESGAQFDRAKKNGWAWTYGTAAQGAFEQLGIQRPDSFMQSQGDQMAKLADAMTLLAQRDSAPRQNEGPTAAQLEDLLEENRKLRELVMSSMQPVAAAQAAVPPPAEVKPLLSKGTLVNVNGRAGKVTKPNEFGRGARVEYLDEPGSNVLVPFDQLVELKEEND